MSAYWTSWLVNRFIFAVPPVLIFCAGLYATTIIQYADFGFTFVCLWLFAICNVSLAVFIVGLSRSNKEAFGIGMMFFMFSIGAFYLVQLLMIEDDEYMQGNPTGDEYMLNEYNNSYRTSCCIH